MSELQPCPHCRKPVELIETQGGYAIICTDHNCLGGMEIHYGWNDDRDIFKRKLISNWNRRTPEVRAVNAAVECIREYGKELYESMQEPYDDHGACCMRVVEDVLNRLTCFTSQAAVDAWSEPKEEQP